MTINLDDINTYFSLFGNEKSIHTVCFMDKASEKPIVGYGIFHGTVNEIINCIQNLEEIHSVENGGKGVTLHLCLNETDLKGRKKGNIVRARVLCVDIDTVTNKDVVKALINSDKPHMVVESSPGKYHLYWRLAAGIPLDVWSKLQLGIASYFDGSDKGLDDITKNIRVPGVERVCKSGEVFMPHIVYVSEEFIDGQSHDLNSITTLFPDWNHAYERAAAKRKEDRKKLHKAIDKGEVALLPEGRNSTLYTAIKDATFKGLDDMEEAYELGCRINAGFDVPLDNVECQRASVSAFKHGIEARRESNKKLIARLGGPDMEEVEHVNGVMEVNGVINSVDKSVENVGEDRELTPMEVLQQSLGEVEFDYDYGCDELKLSRFSDAAVVERVFQRYGDYFLRLGKAIMAFDDTVKLWRSQRGSPEVISEYVDRCIADTIADPLFGETFCRTKEGNPSIEKRDKAITKFKNANLNKSLVSSIIDNNRIKRANQHIFDANNDHLYVSNGVLNLRTGELREARATDYLFHQSPVKWNPDANMTWWHRYVSEVFQRNDTVRSVEFMQQLFGYSISGNINITKVFIHLGSNCNGKSKVLSALRAIIGQDYSAKISGNNLARSKNSIAQDLERIGAKVEGKRVIVIDDLDTQTQWNEDMVKNFTDSSIKARKLYEEEREVANHMKLHVGCNQTPIPTAGSGGIMRRLCIIPYNMQFEPDADKEIEIVTGIQANLEGILRWAVEGYQALLLNGFKLPYTDEITESIEEYRETNFAAENLIPEWFMKPTTQEQKDSLDNWHSIQTLTDFLNEKVLCLGSRHQFTTEELGLILTSKHNFEKKRTRTGDRGSKKVTKYLVVIKSE